MDVCRSKRQFAKEIFHSPLFLFTCLKGTQEYTVFNQAY